MSEPNKTIRYGGLIPSGGLVGVSSVIPLRDGPDVSWLHLCLPGDDQGSEGACALFSFASWCEIMFHKSISDSEVLDLYARTMASLGREDTGLTFQEAFEAVHREGWMHGGQTGIRRVGDLLSLAQQPILAGYSVEPAWDNVSKQGCLDHSATGQGRGYHAVCIVAHGFMERFNSRGRYVYIENSWGLGWGWNGIGVMSEKLHRRMIGEMWIVV